MKLFEQIESKALVISSQAAELAAYTASDDVVSDMSNFHTLCAGAVSQIGIAPTAKDTQKELPDRSAVEACQDYQRALALFVQYLGIAVGDPESAKEKGTLALEQLRVMEENAHILSCFHKTRSKVKDTAISPGEEMILDRLTVLENRVATLSSQLAEAVLNSPLKFHGPGFDPISKGDVGSGSAEDTPGHPAKEDP